MLKKHFVSGFISVFFLRERKRERERERMRAKSRRQKWMSVFVKRHQDKFVCLILFLLTMLMFMRGSGNDDDATSRRNRVLEAEAARWSNIVTDLTSKLEDLERNSGISSTKRDDVKDVKIYVYDLPKAYNEEILKAHPSCGPNADITWETKYATEVYIHQRLLKSQYRTTNPEEADLFYVPVYHACYLHARATKFTKAYQLIRLAHDHIQTKFPFWNRTMGRDHVWTFAHDMGGCVAPYEELRHSIWITTTGEMLNRKKAFERYTKMYVVETVNFITHILCITQLYQSNSATLKMHTSTFSNINTREHHARSQVRSNIFVRSRFLETVLLRLERCCYATVRAVRANVSVYGVSVYGVVSCQPRKK